jgi:hypothetical protein
MAWTPTEKEVAAVLQLGGPQRYSYCIKRIADQEVVWSLWQEGGWALVGDDEGRQLVPVWPHEKFAALCACDVWTGYMPKSIKLNVWLERWIPGIKQDGRLVAVFPTPRNRGVAVTPVRFGEDIREELTHYE